jgi:molybdenum cofactor cytidylyltransferase
VSAIGVVLLAAGGSGRMGTPKQLLPFGGKPLVRHCAEVALAAFQPVIAVVGASAAEVEAALAGLPVQVVHNVLWERGVGTSIQTGVRRAEELGLEGVVLLPADQPLVTAEHLRALEENQATSGKSIVASRYAGTVGVPVLFSRQYFPHLLRLEPGKGCKGIIMSNEQHALLVDCQAAEFDIDTPDDYASLPSNDAALGRIRDAQE